MAVTDLTGTTWYFNDNLTSALPGPDYGVEGIEFDCLVDGEVKSFSVITCPYDGPGYFQLYYCEPNVEEYIVAETADYVTFWYTSYYGNSIRTISITGGIEATNSDLIAWLQENATQITDDEPIVDADC